MRRSLLRVSAAVGATAAVVATAGAFAPHANAASGSTALPGTTPRWLPRASTQATPSATTGAAQSVRVYLTPNGGQANLDQAVKAVSTPGSASYRHYLSPSQYFATYAPTASQVSSVSSWLKSSGLSVTSVETHNRWIDATGDQATLDKAFGVTLKHYAHDGQNVVAPDGPTYVPTSLVAAISAVGGLDTTKVYATHDAAADTSPPPAAFRNAKPCSAYYGQIAAKNQADYKTPLPTFNGKTLPYAVCGYTGPQLRSAYEGSQAGVLTGAGVGVAIIDAYDSPTIASDAATYANNHGDASYASGQLTQSDLKPFTNQDLCGENGWWGEQTLDVEAVHAMAPAAKVVYVGAASCLDDDLRAAQQRIVDHSAASIVSNSYGEPEEDASADSVVADNAVFEQGAMEGISFAFSSGDDGDEVANTGLKQADSSASNAYVTAVGGTSTAIDVNGNRAFDTGWGTNKYTFTNGAWKSIGYLYGAGGGFSNLSDRPSYQEGVVPSSAPAGRAVPDVAMDADPTTGMLIGQTQTNPDGTVAYGEFRIGGTSLASPLFAALTALKIQKAGGRLGFLNPTIYASKTSFTDVKGTPPDAGNVRVDFANAFDPSNGYVYSIRTFNQDASLTTTTGWDDVTGVGVPNTTWITTK